MTTPTDKQLVRMAAWPAGIDNQSPEQALTRDDQGRTVIAVLMGAGAAALRASVEAAI